MKLVLFSLISMIAVGSFASPSYAGLEEETPLLIKALSDGREILTTPEGLTVYVFDKDNAAASNCYDACATAWPPVLATAGVELGSAVSTTTRKDGSQQLIYNGRPIYLFAGDGAPGDINGDGLGGVWHIVTE